MYQASIERERFDSQILPVSDRKGVSGNNAALQVRSEYITWPFLQLKVQNDFRKCV